VSFRARLAALAVAIAALLAVSHAHAELRVSASPILGANTPSNGAWVECVVRIENDGTRAEQGHVEIQSVAGYSVDNQLSVKTAYAVTGGSTVNVRLPIRTFPHSGGSLDLIVTNEGGAEVVRTAVATSGAAGPFLLDATEPPRLAGALRDVPTSIVFDPTGGSLPRSHVGGKVNVATGSLRVDSATGDPVMPERAAGYASATLVVMRSDQLSRMSGMQLDALANFVLSGGSLAVTVARPEDLRSGSLVTFVGGEVTSGPAPRTLRRTPGEEIESPADHGSGSGRRTGKRVYPGEDVDNGMVGYTGGNLRPTLHGAAASYGLGEVHILAFDPTQAPGVDDAWVKSRMLDLVAHAWDRRQFLAVPHGAVFPDEYRMNSVFKVLDPNQSSRWAIIVAAVLLIAYSVLAGPVNFTRAARKQRPLRALWVLPALSLVTFLMLVVLGVAAKGWSGKARHLTMIEAAAGMAKGTACRYRGFFTSGSRQLTVRATDVSSVLDTATEPRAGASRSLVVDRDGVQLVGLSTMPWETLVVREDGFASLGAGLSVTRDANDEVVLTNRMARDLRAVLVIEAAPAAGSPRKVYFFPRLRDGESKRASEGTPVPFEPWSTSSTRISESDLAPIRRELEGESSGLVTAWSALGTTSERNVDWWPEDVPIVLAQVDGGEGDWTDSGLRLDSDRVLLRVVGWGGVP
jgi:hypothetical protein